MNIAKMLGAACAWWCPLLALLNPSKYAVLVNKEGIKYTSQLPTKTDLLLTKLYTSWFGKSLFYWNYTA